MPLLDHFHPPLSERRHWEAFHTRWASAIADELNEHGLPENLFAEPTVQLGGQVQVDVATMDDLSPPSGNGARTRTATATAPPTWVIPAVFSDAFEVRVINTEGGPRLVAAIELISPSNKDRPETRRASASKCASYLYQGIPFIIVDVVTSRRANLHNEIMDLMLASGFHMSAELSLYAASYRPVRRDSNPEIDVRQETLHLGSPLPSLPLYVEADLVLQMDFEMSYLETCRRLRVS